MPLEIKKAVRRALPLQIAFVGPMNSGKTLSALLFAAGLIGPNEKVVVIDTERGRASMYADNKRVMAALPQGFDVIELDAPYHPQRFIEAIDVAESAGYKVCLIDSASDAWDGPGGCSDIAEKNKNTWNIPKLWNKRLLTRIALSDMHIICCLRAQEKTKIIDKAKSASGKQEYVDLGMQPVCEKNFFSPMTFAFSVDSATHLAKNIKTHDDVADFYKEPRMITKADGEKLRLWNEGGQKLADNEQLIKRSKYAAQQGKEKYREFVQSLTAEQRKRFPAAVHEENKKAAGAVDQVPTFGSAENPVEWPDSFEGTELIWNGKRLKWDEESGNYAPIDQATAA